MTVSTRERMRVWFLEDRAGPANTPVYMKNMKAGTPAKNFGNITRIEAPDPNRYGAFLTVGEVRSVDERAAVELIGRYDLDVISRLLRVAQKKCKVDVQVHMGRCQNPSVFNSGWDKILNFEDGTLTTWSTPEQLGALDSGEQGPINEQSNLSADRVYEILPLKVNEQAAAQVVGEVVAITVCDQVACGDCGVSSGGCGKVFAVSISSLTSPAGANDLLWTKDGGVNWTARAIDIWSQVQDPSAVLCVGDNIVILQQTIPALAWIPKAQVILSTGAFTQVTTGFVALKGPNAGWVLSPSEVWIVGQGGYVYFTSDPTASVTVQDAGIATAQNLNDVHAFDSSNVLAVGNSNAVIFSTNGGGTWVAVTGPAVGVNLNACWMKSPTEWFVGSALGRLYYTQDAGNSWIEKTFPGSGTGVIRDIAFAPGKPSVGFLSHITVATVGRVLRSVDGGYSWYALPESTTSFPANNRIDQLAVCDQNTFWGAGLGSNGTDGIIVKGA